MDEYLVFRVCIEGFLKKSASFFKELYDVLSWGIEELQDFVLILILEARVDVRGTSQYVSDTMLLESCLVIGSAYTSLVHTRL